MKVLVIIVSYNFERWMDRCIGSLRRSEYPVDTVIIDNGSQDATVALLKERYPEVHVVCNRENLGFGKANNIGMRLALEKGYDAVFLLNQDAWIDPNTIGTLVALCRKYPSFGILSPVHLTGKGDAIDAGFADYTGIHTTEELPHSEITEVPFVNAAFWMIPTSVLRTVGGFSPLFYHYGEDVDFVHRLHYHGLKVGYALVFGNHDRELRTVTKPMEYRAKCVYLLTAYANINHSFGYAFTKAIGGGCEQVVKSLKRGLWKDAAVYLQRTCILLLKSGKIYRLRTLYRKPGSHFITHQSYKPL